VAECAGIARDDDLKGQVLMVLVVLKSWMTITEAELQQQLISRIRDTIGKTLAHIVNSKEYRVPSTIDDPGVIPEIIEVLRGKKLVR
jgi:propionyl-CoA synthetase